MTNCEANLLIDYLRRFRHDAVVQRLRHAVVEVDAALRCGQALLQLVHLPLADLLTDLEQVPRDALSARRRREGAVPMVVAVRQLLCEFRVEIEVVAGVLGHALLVNRKGAPELVQEGVAIIVGAQLVEQADDSEAVVRAVECRVVELVHEVRLHSEELAVDGVLRGGVPMHLVEVEFVTTNHGVALGTTTVIVNGNFDVRTAVVDAAVRARLKDLEAVARVLHIRRLGLEVSRNRGGCGLFHILRHDVDGRLLMASGAEPAPCRFLRGRTGSGFPGIGIHPVPGHLHGADVVHGVAGRVLRHLRHDAVVQRLRHTVVEVDAALRCSQALRQLVHLPLADLLTDREQVPRDTLSARWRREGAVPMVVAVRQLLCEFRVEIEVVAGVLGHALGVREGVPELVQEGVALIVGA
mmetsp:Transcript_21113/g.68349  ORF Transcript_21113/g.68349 Transcript_21113/m.68349 type:complete len:411 (+) Transcript_21113:262-1494(+)